MIKIAVVGAGASGLVAAIFAKNDNTAVTVFDGNKVCGKKILKTGNGKCNFSNADLKAEHFQSESPDYIEAVFERFGPNELLKFMKSIGVEPLLEGKLYYPYSLQAKAVRDLLERRARALKVRFVLDSRIENIKKVKGKYKLYSADKEYVFDKVIIASGGMADPKSGSDGKLIDEAYRLGHSVILPMPALTALESDDEYLKRAGGVRIDAEIELKAEDKYCIESGNLQITDYGISGICVMQLSYLASLALFHGMRVSCIIDFLPGIEKEELFEILMDRFYGNGKISPYDALVGLLPDKLIDAILRRCGLVSKKDASVLEKNEFYAIMHNIKGYELRITGVRGFEQAQTTLGGVDFRDTIKGTLESKVTKGLYFCGEILDACGECGGFNLGFAFCSGAVAGMNCGGNNG